MSLSITGVDSDTINFHAMGCVLKPAATEFFAAQIAGFDATYGVTSSKFAGSTVVPLPADVWLVGCGLVALAGLVRYKACY